MNFKEFKTGINDIDRRIDKILKILFPEFSLNEIYKYIRKGLIKLNNKKTTPETHIQNGDIIYIAEFLLSQKKEDNIPKSTSNLPPILYKNEHILIINKPYNTLVQANGTKQIPLDVLIQNYYKNGSSNESLSFNPGPLHRLDKNTSGILCFSWSINGAKWFSQNIQNHLITKKYAAIIEGHLEKEEIWQDYIFKDFNSNKAFQTVKINNTEPPNAYTIATPIAKGFYNNKPITFVKFDIKTGKTHQIRSQSSFHKHPLLGDTAYNGEKTNLEREYFLHAYQINFPKNELNIPEKIICPFSKDMSDIILKTCNIKTCYIENCDL